MTETLYVVTIRTADGEFTATYSHAGLCGLAFPPLRPRTRSGPTATAVGLPGKVRRWHSIVVRALANVLAGRKPGRLPPLDLSCGTEFQRAVWGALGRIECGQTLGYGEIANSLGRPGAARAVGGACGANPVPLLVPCHRVLAAGKKLGGFSGGLNWKRLLLTREGVRL